MKTLVGMVTALTMFFLFSVNVHSAGKGIEVSSEQASPGVNSLEDIQNTNADFTVELWTDKKDNSRDIYHAGDEVVFFFKTNKDCRLTLINVGTTGKVNVIFPNKHQDDNLVKAGVEYRVPPERSSYIFKMDGPAGLDLVKAVATLDNVPLLPEPSIKTEGATQNTDMPQSMVARDISISLKPIDSKRWAETELTLKVVGK
jgi:hypothetical protein